MDRADARQAITGLGWELYEDAEFLMARLPDGSTALFVDETRSWHTLRDDGSLCPLPIEGLTDAKKAVDVWDVLRPAVEAAGVAGIEREIPWLAPPPTKAVD